MTPTPTPTPTPRFTDTHRAVGHFMSGSLETSSAARHFDSHPQRSLFSSISGTLHFPLFRKGNLAGKIG